MSDEHGQVYPSPSASKSPSILHCSLQDASKILTMYACIKIESQSMPQIIAYSRCSGLKIFESTGAGDSLMMAFMAIRYANKNDSSGTDGD